MPGKERRNKPKARLTGIKPAGKRLHLTPYQTLRLVASGQLQVELVDNRPKITLESLERYEEAIAR